MVSSDEGAFFLYGPRAKLLNVRGLCFCVSTCAIIVICGRGTDASERCCTSSTVSVCLSLGRV